MIDTYTYHIALMRYFYGRRIFETFMLMGSRRANTHEITAYVEYAWVFDVSWNWCLLRISIHYQLHNYMYLTIYVVVVHWRTKYCGFVTLKEPQNLLDMSSSDSCIGAQTSELRPLYVYYQSFVMLCFGLWSLRLPTLQKTTTTNLLCLSQKRFFSKGEGKSDNYLV